ncbi:MAG: DUF1289 domain-containing protein [Beijerinckiaceae bacterium]|nr:DUF1289 domain-containing protein [Beijerinckiaceae bacterium]
MCQLDPATRLCLGCGRSLNEIGRWSNLSEAERRAIMTELPARLGARKSVGAP